MLTHKKAMLHSFVDTETQMGQCLLDRGRTGPSRRHHNDAHWLFAFDNGQGIDQTRLVKCGHSWSWLLSASGDLVVDVWVFDVVRWLGGKSAGGIDVVLPKRGQRISGPGS